MLTTQQRNKSKPQSPVTISDNALSQQIAMNSDNANQALPLEVADDVINAGVIEVGKHGVTAHDIERESLRIWNEAIELLALAKLDANAAVYLSSTISHTSHAIGLNASKQNAELTNFTIIKANNKSNNSFSFSRFNDLKTDVETIPETTKLVYLPIFFNNAGAFLKGKDLTKALQYIVNELQCDVKIYLHDSADPKIKQEWIERNSNMLKQKGKEFKLDLTPVELTEVMGCNIFDNANSLPMDSFLLNRVDLKESLKLDLAKSFQRNLTKVTPVSEPLSTAKPTSVNLHDDNQLSHDQEILLYLAKLCEEMAKDAPPLKRLKLSMFMELVCRTDSLHTSDDLDAFLFVPPQESERDSHKLASIPETKAEKFSRSKSNRNTVRLFKPAEQLKVAPVTELSYETAMTMQTITKVAARG